MIMSLDTRNHKAFLLSVPRDLYVDIAGYRHSKINEAYVAGEQQKFSASGYPSGGMGLLEQTLSETMGIKIHYYALINYGALRDAVNAVGGVDVTIKSDSSCGLYDPSIDWATHGPLVKLSNGKHHLDGREALDLARARGDAPGSCGYANSDFTRTANQRMLLLSLKSKVFSTGVLANPVKLSNLFDSVGRNVKTDMQLNEVRRLYDLTKDVPNSQLKSYGLNDINGKDYLGTYRTETGQSALIPAAGLDDFSDIRRALQRLMSTNPVAQEGAQVVVLNGTDTSGLAGKNMDLLTARGVDVTNIADATSNATTTFIINATGTSKPATLKALKTVYPSSKVTTTNPYATKYPDADYIVVLGDDRLASTSTQ
jgi:LCP family protein required for cell wall assembly